MKVKFLVGGVLLAIAAICAYLLIPRSLDYGWPTNAFSSQKWKESAPKDRFVMVKDLLSSNALVGKGASEVEEMLGSPSYKSPRNDYWLYIVREAQPGELRFDAVVMVDIAFDGSGKVARALLRSD
jgi:hypothetical protein